MMNDMSHEIQQLLHKLNDLLLRSARWQSRIDEVQAMNKWCGNAPADDSVISAREMQLNVTFPPSTRALYSISNGWSPFGSQLQGIVKMESLSRVGDEKPDVVELIKMSFLEDDIRDEEYVQYEDPRSNSFMRHRYYSNSFLLAEAWPGGSEMLLLNPNIVNQHGEWEVILFAHWIPGNIRFRDMLAFLRFHVDNEEMNS